MISYKIKYEDLNGNEIEDEFYFNFNKIEAQKINFAYGDLAETYAVVRTLKEAGEIFDVILDIVYKAYGRKHADGVQFEKEDENGRPLWKAWSQTNAPSELVVKLMDNNIDGFQEFIQGTLPKAFLEQIKKQEAEDNQWSREDLLAMSEEDFNTKVGTDFRQMTPLQQQVAYQRKTATPAK